MESSNKGGVVFCKFCGTGLFFVSEFEVEVLAVGTEGTVTTQLTGCEFCQRLSKKKKFERARDLLLNRFGHSTAVQVAVVEQPPKRKQRSSCPEDEESGNEQ
jgi:hypothetical protein